MCVSPVATITVIDGSGAFLRPAIERHARLRIFRHELWLEIQAWNRAVFEGSGTESR
jgi:sRNA-binding carbon storage regulator CsrA